MTTNEEGVALPSQGIEAWDDDAIATILKLRRLPNKLQNGWSVMTIVAAAEIIRLVRDDWQADRTRLTARIAELEKSLSVGDALYNGAVDTIAKLEAALTESRRLLAEATDGWEDVNTVECECGEEECGKYTWIERDNSITRLWHYDGKQDSFMYLPPANWRIQRRRSGATSGGQQDE